jgi:hypothetical protein
MSKFGQTLFGGGGFIRWALSPFVLLFAVVMPLVIEEWTFGAAVMIGGMELMCLCLLAGFWLPPRIGFCAFRVLAGMVALAYAAYLVDEFFLSNKSFTVTGRRSAASPFNALLGFLVIGVPSLWFALKGRFTLRAEASPEQLAAERQAYEDRILRPDWEFYERHLQRPAPAALRELYADRALVTSGGLDYSKAGGISTFNPLSEEGLLDTREQVGSDVVAFATSGCGDPIYLRPGASETDKVYIAYHDDLGNVQVFADSVAEMLERLRYANDDT